MSDNIFNEEFSNNKLIKRRKKRKNRKIKKQELKRPLLSFCFKLFGKEVPENLHMGWALSGVAVVVVLILGYSSIKSYLEGYFYEKGITNALYHPQENSLAKGTVSSVSGEVLAASDSPTSLLAKTPSTSTSSIMNLIKK